MVQVYYREHWGEMGKIIGKVALSLLAFLVSIILMEIVGQGLSFTPTLLVSSFSIVLIFPIWYPSQVSKRLIAAITGLIVGLGLPMG
mgnify:CR=1 FL=1|jgi:hypothetical protein